MKIDIIGKGNVATHLLTALSRDTINVLATGSRDFAGLRPDSDLYILAVSDNAIPEVAERLKGKLPPQAVLAHTSGTTPLSVLDGVGCHTGVFYPLQTFSMDVHMEYDTIPLLIEGSDPVSTSMLTEVADMISHNVQQMDTAQRRKVHLASVVACNFANHLWTMSAEYLKKHDIDFNLLLPLLDETVRKLHELSPEEAQTGPAARHDTVTINRHMEMLAGDDRLREIYRLMSDSIMDATQLPDDNRTNDDNQTTKIKNN